MAQVVLPLVAVRYLSRFLRKPLYKASDFIHAIPRPEAIVTMGKQYHAARNANKYATLLDIAYDYYELEGKDADCIKSWKDLKYELIPSTEYRDEAVRKLVESPLREVVVLRKIRSESSGNRSSVKPDRIVVLFRGTCLKTFRDLWEDFKIAFEVLHNSDRVSAPEALVKELVSKQLLTYGRHGIRLVGHSLGAAVGFIIARRLHLIDPTKTLEGHFFNLPYMDLETFYTEMLCAFSPAHALAGAGNNILHRIPALEQILRRVTGMTARALVGKKAEELDAEFAKLADFKPNIYVSNYDRFSRGYIGFFRNSDLGNGSFGMTRITAVLNILRCNATSQHLCPSANLIISWKSFCSARSHKLDIWKREDKRSIRVESYTSLRRDQFTT